MALDVEAIWTALAERLAEALRSAGVNEVVRRPKLQYVTEELPVVILRDDEGSEDLLSDPDAAKPIWRLGAEIQIHARAVETDAAPTSQLNALVRSVREALEFDAVRDATSMRPTHYTTLGRLVRVLAITKVEKGIGALTGQPSAQVTITIEALG